MTCRLTPASTTTGVQCLDELNVENRIKIGPEMTKSRDKKDFSIASDIASSDQVRADDYVPTASCCNERPELICLCRLWLGGNFGRRT